MREIVESFTHKGDLIIFIETCDHLVVSRMVWVDDKGGDNDGYGIFELSDEMYSKLPDEADDLTKALDNLDDSLGEWQCAQI